MSNPIGDPVTINSDESDLIQEVSPNFDVVGFMMMFESDSTELTDDDIVTGFQHLIDTGIINSLQGFYGRFAAGLAEEGWVTL